jgi:hypothetical protein
MKKVFQLLKKDAPIKGEVGIEIECEGKNMVPVDFGGWKTEDDGSLRGHFPDSRAEYVLAKPIMAKEVQEKVDFLRTELKEATLDFSFRTSVHIHINVQDLTEAQVMNFVYTYLLLEEPMVNFCGRERKGNRFCLRIADAEGIIGYYSKMFAKGLAYIMAVNENDLRYAGINLASLKKYGSIEFRSMRGCMDAETLHIWANSLMAIKKYAEEKKVPLDINREFSNGAPRDFLRTVLGEYAVYFEYPRMAKEIQRSFSLTLELPYMYKEQVYKEEVALEAKQKRADNIPEHLVDQHKEFMVSHMWNGVIGDNMSDFEIRGARLFVKYQGNWVDATIANKKDIAFVEAWQAAKQPAPAQPEPEQAPAVRPARPRRPVAQPVEF